MYQMTNNDIENKKPINPLPKNPPMNFGGGTPSVFSKGSVVGPKIVPKIKFNQSTFHTQHKGGTVGGGK